MYPLRTYVSDGIDHLFSPTVGTALTAVYTLFTQSSVGNVITDALSHWGNDSVLANGNDSKIIMESANQILTVQNGCTIPMTIEAYWVIPRRDQPQTGLNIVSLLNATTTGSVNNTTVIPFTDLNSSIWRCPRFLTQYKIIKSNRQIIMPGAQAKYENSVGRRVVSTSAWDPISSLNAPPLYSKGYMKGLIFRVYNDMAINVSAANTITTGVADMLIRSQSTYKYRPMVDMRPTYLIAASNMNTSVNTSNLVNVNSLDAKQETASYI